MPHTFHSHSGSYCHHAKDSLDAVVSNAFRLEATHMALTEHMPRRNLSDLYPEEIEAKVTPEILARQFSDYYVHAKRLQKEYSTKEREDGSKMEILVGMETDWITPEMGADIHDLLISFPLDLFVGSLHHVCSIPIDFDQERFTLATKAALALRKERDFVQYEQSRSDEGKTEDFAAESLWLAYLHEQHVMLRSLKPPIVGHFDLLRLLGGSRDLRSWRQGQVWTAIRKNLQLMKGYGCCMEINGAACRKGLGAPYPGKEIAQEYLSMGGSFVLSDDSHGLAQQFHSYKTMLEYVKAWGIKEVCVFELNSAGSPADERFPGISKRFVTVDEVMKEKFWSLL